MNEPTEETRVQVLAYLKNEMTDEERALFEERMTVSGELRDEVERTREFLDSLSAASDASIVRLVNSFISHAIDAGASDIHILPERNTLTVRLRRDGVLQDYAAPPRSLSQAIVDRWKVMADMNVAERRLPQDGRIPLRHNDKDYDLRVNILPTLYGERVTARILDRSSIKVDLELLGYTEAQQSTLKRWARLRAGLILVGGWADTGKTTLLYSLVKEAQSPDLPKRNIITIEDPIEMQLPGVSQVAVNRRIGLTGAAALTCMRRSDPDMVMYSDIRDAETAAICVELASTGHLVVASLPVANATGVIERLRGFGIPDFLIADSLVGVVGLQLVRRVDTLGTEEYVPSDEDLNVAGLTREDGPFRRGVPSDTNGNTGYRGRIPLLEILEVNDRLRRRIAQGVVTEELFPDAFPEGRGSLRHDARDRVKAGMTTVEEVNWALTNYPRV